MSKTDPKGPLGMVACGKCGCLIYDLALHSKWCPNIELTPDTFTEKAYDTMMAIEGDIVKALERNGFDPCPAIKVAQCATRKAWDVWNMFMTERVRLRQSIFNQAGDNLCWMANKPVQIPPRAEFLESCSRYHAQISTERGELPPGCMTIAQLEAECERWSRAYTELSERLKELTR